MKTKTILFLALVLVNFLPTQAQSDIKGLARVNKMLGVEVYFLSEPIRAYDVVFDESTGLKMTALLTGGIVTESAADKANQFVKRVLSEAKDQKIEVDAVIYSGGKKVIAVRFKEAATVENKGIARVSKINGTEIYAFAEPMRDYEKVSSKGGGLKMKSFVTGGLVNNSIEEDLQGFVKKIQSDCEDDNKQLDAVIYSTGKSAIGVRFK